MWDLVWTDSLRVLSLLLCPLGRNQYFVMNKRKFFKANISQKEAVEAFLDSINLSRKSMICSHFLLPKVKVLVFPVFTHLSFKSLFSLYLFPEAPGLCLPLSMHTLRATISSPSPSQACEMSGDSLTS